MSAHAERTHALLSPSGAHRWLTCTPSARLEEQFPDTSSPYADEGTLAHELCEVLVTGYIEDTPKRTITAKINKLKKREPWQDEMRTHAETYLDYVKAAYLECSAQPHIVVEKRVDLTPWIPDGSGIADCIIIGCGVLHVIDFKYGKGVPVTAEANPQLLLYALGAYNAYGHIYDIDTIKLSIVQPRISAAASTWETYLDDALQWSERVKEKAILAAAGDGDFNPSEDACRFCKARQVCRARADHNVQMAFEKTDDGEPLTKTKPEVLGLDEIGAYLDKGGDVAKWLEDLKAYALSQALLGNDVDGWKAVEGRGSRDWTDREAAFKALIDAGTKEALLYETSPLSLAAIEKQMGKKAFEEIAGSYVVKKPGKPTLVPSTDKREAITMRVTAAEAFN